MKGAITIIAICFAAGILLAFMGVIAADKERDDRSHQIVQVLTERLKACEAKSTHEVWEERSVWERCAEEIRSIITALDLTEEVERYR